MREGEASKKGMNLALSSLLCVIQGEPLNSGCVTSPLMSEGGASSLWGALRIARNKHL